MKVKLSCGHSKDIRADLVDAVKDASVICPKCKEFKKVVKR